MRLEAQKYLHDIQLAADRIERFCSGRTFKLVRSEVHHDCQLPELAAGDLLAAIRLEGEPEEAMTEFVPDH
jgi:hypothetical protein